MAHSPEKEWEVPPPAEEDFTADVETKVDLAAVNPIAELSEPIRKIKSRKKR